MTTSSKILFIFEQQVRGEVVMDTGTDPRGGTEGGWGVLELACAFRVSIAPYSS